MSALIISTLQIICFQKLTRYRTVLDRKTPPSTPVTCKTSPNSPKACLRLFISRIWIADYNKFVFDFTKLMLMVGIWWSMMPEMEGWVPTNFLEAVSKLSLNSPDSKTKVFSNYRKWSTFLFSIYIFPTSDEDSYVDRLFSIPNKPENSLRIPKISQKFPRFP